MSPTQKRDFKRMSVNYAYDFKEQVILETSNNKKRKSDRNESKKFLSW